MSNAITIQVLKVAIVYLIIILPTESNLAAGMDDQIYLKDKTHDSGIDFIHYAPRPRWCEIGPSVVGTATNEGLDLVLSLIHI